MQNIECCRQGDNVTALLGETVELRCTVLGYLPASHSGTAFKKWRFLILIKMGLRVNPHRELSFHFFFWNPPSVSWTRNTADNNYPTALTFGSKVSGQLGTLVRSEGHLWAGVHLLQQDLGVGGAATHLGVEGGQRHCEGRRAVRVSPQPGHGRPPSHAACPPRCPRWLNISIGITR